MTECNSYCRICGAEDEGAGVEYRGAWWDADEGWRISPLCASCWGEAKAGQPKPADFAYARRVSRSSVEVVLDACGGDLDGAEV